MNDLRMNCGSYGFKAPITRWNEGDNIWGAFGPIFRGVNDKKHIIRKKSGRKRKTKILEKRIRGNAIP